MTEPCSRLVNLQLIGKRLQFSLCILNSGNFLKIYQHHLDISEDWTDERQWVSDVKWVKISSWSALPSNPVEHNPRICTSNENKWKTLTWKNRDRDRWDGDGDSDRWRQQAGSFGHWARMLWAWFLNLAPSVMESC